MPTVTSGVCSRPAGLLCALRWAWILLLLGGGHAPAIGRETGVGSLLILGAPPGRQVWIDGKFAGLLPLQVDSLPVGNIWVEVGGTPAERRWRPATRIRAIVSAGRLDTLNLGSILSPTGAKDGRTSSLPIGEELLTPSAPPTPRAALLLPAAAVAMGIAGFWCRHEADRAYEDYQSTLDRAAMGRHFRRSEQLDRVAVACWLGSEACILTAAWIWLRAGPELPVAASADRGTVRVGVGLPILSAAPAGEGR